MRIIKTYQHIPAATTPTTTAAVHPATIARKAKEE
jgi:hypothetical protein